MITMILLGILGLAFFVFLVVGICMLLGILGGAAFVILDVLIGLLPIVLIAWIVAKLTTSKDEKKGRKKSKKEKTK